MALRQLPALLTANPESIEMVTALVRASQEDLAQSDAVLVASTVMGVTTEQFADYLDQLTPETTETDLQTFCNIAALMREHDLLPEKGEMISMKDLEDPALLEQVAQELGETGRILVRESGTEPVIRVMVEAPSKQICQECVDRVVNVICAQGHARV